jgi:transglutaminase-like putative cysteine protease
MYDIKQFKPVLYFLVFLGITGFALAVETPGLWLLSLSVISLQIWLARTNRFRPLPRLLANSATLLALLYTFYVIRFAETPIIVIGQFLVLMQLIKLFELRANRDYAQLLVLSLLLMVAGAISTPSLLFALLFALWIFVSLYTCLLFHLKVENDRALAAQTLPTDRVSLATVRQDQRYLPRSMRKLAALVSAAAVFMAVFVFLFFPRGTGAGMFGQLQFRPSQTLTGFSDSVSLTDVTRIQQNNEIVAQVQVWKNDEPVQGTQTLYLRGKTLDLYFPDLRKWERSSMAEDGLEGPAALDLRRTPERPGEKPPDVYRQRISLKPTGTTTIFAMPGPVGFNPARPTKIRFFPDDETITTAEPLYQRLEYEVRSRNYSIDANPVDDTLNRITRLDVFREPPSPNAPEAAIPPRVAAYARLPEVGGVDDQNRPLASLRAPNVAVSPLDAQIAANIQKHLRTKFAYTLDLTAEKRDRNKDPVEQFLEDWKKGHCEYFASAMVLMCQSLGMQARMVTGFRCDEYDPNMGQYYVVRQSHAHAWVEVKTTNGWQTYDPTSGIEDGAPHRTSVWQSVKHFFDYLEFTWADKVVAYDADRRENLISNIDRQMVNAVVNTPLNPNRSNHRIQDWWSDLTGAFSDWLESGQGWLISARLIVGLICILLAALVYFVANYLVQRHRMRRRAARIGLDNLPTAEQIRLARQLGFYERLMRLLESRRIVRPRHLTPREFSDSLTFLPNEAYDTIRRLTQIFYTIRYGRRDLPHDEQKDLESTVDTLEPFLTP